MEAAATTIFERISIFFLHKMKPINLRHTILAVSIAHLFPAIAFAAGAIDGKVQEDAAAKRPLAGVLVTIRETGASASTGKDGQFSFHDVAPGSYTLALQVADQAVIDRKITVADQETLRPEILLEPSASAAQQITVLAQFAPAAIARAAQQEAPNLVNITTSAEMKKLPDVNTGEAVRRLPGVSLETDEGEGRYVNIRGLDADLNSTTFGGVRLPPTNNASPFGGYRAVTFDSIPIGLVGAIAVTKSNLPEQDAEALGGTIEITPKTAPANGRPFLQGNVGFGREELRGTNITDISISGGGRFGGSAPADSNIVAYRDRPFSFVGTLAYYEDKRGFDDVEPAYLDSASFPHNAYSAIDQRVYQLHRRRHGYGIDLGYRPDADNSYYFRAFDAGHTESYLSDHLTITPDGNPVALGNGQYSDTLNANGALVKKLRDEQETIRDQVFVLGGKNKFDGRTLDYRVAFTKGSYDKPYDYNSSYTYAPANGANSDANILYSLGGKDSTPKYAISGTAANDYANPANYTLSSFRNSTASNYDKETSFASNLDSPVSWGGFDDESFKVGGSVRLRKKLTTSPQYSYQNLPAIPLTAAAGGPNVTYYDGQYQNGPAITPGYLQGQLGSGTQQPGDVISTAQQFLSAKEDVYAAYGQYQYRQGAFGLVGGVRYEATRDHSDALSTSNNGADPAPVSGSRHYANFFPGLQVKYELQPDLQIRAAYSSTIARPGFNQVNPSLSVDTGAGIIARGNPDLKPATANSFDLSIEKYLPDAGILSFGLFDKEIKDYIVPSVSTQVVSNDAIFAGITGPVRVASYSNAGKSYARGFEFNYEQRFKKLPGILSGLGAGINWTYVSSRFEIRPGEYSSLPSSSKNTANATIFYERNGVNLRLAGYYVSRDLFAIQGTGIDVYNSSRFSMDFGGTVAIDKNLAVYFNAKNLLDTPHRFEEGSSDRVIQREFYGKTFQLGLNFNY